MRRKHTRRNSNLQASINQLTAGVNVSEKKEFILATSVLSNEFGRRWFVRMHSKSLARLFAQGLNLVDLCDSPRGEDDSKLLPTNKVGEFPANSLYERFPFFLTHSIHGFCRSVGRLKLVLLTWFELYGGASGAFFKDEDGNAE